MTETAAVNIPAPWASSKRINLVDTCYQTPCVNARKNSPDSALLQIWTLEGKGMRMTTTSLSKADCLRLAETLSNLAETIC
jgi:hypothetical protein